MRWILVAVLLFVVPLCAQADEPPPLAVRCNAIEWKIHPGASVQLPVGLTAVQTELSARKADVLDEIEEALPYSRNLRRIAAPVVATWPSDQARRILIGLLADKDVQTAADAAFYLGDVGGKEVVPSLLEAAEKRGGMVGHNALNALSHLGMADQAFTAAMAMLSDRLSWMRHSAVQLLEKVDGSAHVAKAKERLTALLESERDAGVRGAAERALRILTAKS